MSQYARTSRPLTAQVEAFPLPTNKQEFDQLGYLQRLALFEQQPSVYKRFTKQPEDEEKQW